MSEVVFDKNQSPKGQWGIYFVLISTTIGLGNLWRFPYAVHEGGGALFLVIYLILLFFFGTPLIISELLIGKIQKKGVLSATHKKSLLEGKLNKKRNFIQKLTLKILTKYGYVSFFVSLLILGYLAVVSGWVLYFLFFSILELTRPGFFNLDQALFQIEKHNFLQIILASLHLFLMSFLIRKSLQYQVKKWLGYFAPLLSIFMLLLIYEIYTSYNIEKALRFMFYPQFYNFNWSTLSSALGQLTLSLGIGIGVMVSFGNQSHKFDYIPAMGYRVSIIDALYSLISMLFILPLIFILSDINLLQGPEMIFQVVPLFFQNIEHGPIFSIFFFTFLYLAAMGGSITLLQTLTQNIEESTRLTKKKALPLVIMITILLSILPSLSSQFLDVTTSSNFFSLKKLDILLIHWLLPFTALLASQQIRLYIDDQTLEDEFLDMTYPSTFLLFNHWQFILKWVIPTLIILSMVIR